MLMPGRKYAASELYKYGFNGKDNDNEVKGEGNQQDYGLRIYDPRLGKFVSLDPISQKYPELTPYQFASNRPIDGTDLDGAEYIVFHVKITRDAQGKPVFSKKIALDNRGLSALQMAFVHQRPDYAINFYESFSESFGSEGRGFKWVYFDENDKQIGEPVWQMKQSLFFNFSHSGYYSGAGSITKYGPGTSTGLYPELNNDYDFSYTPMNRADEISKEHDMTQENTIIQPQGWLEDVRTLPSDIVLKYKVDQALKKSHWESEEDKNRLKNMQTFFDKVIMYKMWKIRHMRYLKIDETQIDNQRKVILRDWKTIPGTKEWFAKLVLLGSGGGASEEERNSVKPVQLKKP